MGHNDAATKAGTDNLSAQNTGAFEDNHFRQNLMQETWGKPPERSSQTKQTTAKDSNGPLDPASGTAQGGLTQRGGESGTAQGGLTHKGGESGTAQGGLSHKGGESGTSKGGLIPRGTGDTGTSEGGPISTPLPPRTDAPSRDPETLRNVPKDMPTSDQLKKPLTPPENPPSAPRPDWIKGVGESMKSSAIALSDAIKDAVGNGDKTAPERSGFINPVQAAYMGQRMEAHDRTPTDEDKSDAEKKLHEAIPPYMDKDTKAAVDAVEKAILAKDPAKLAEAIKNAKEQLKDPEKLKAFAQALDESLRRSGSDLHAEAKDGKLVIAGGSFATRGADGSLTYPSGLSIDPKDGSMKVVSYDFSMKSGKPEVGAEVPGADPAKTLEFLGNWAMNEMYFQAHWDPSKIKVDPNVRY